jgi:tripartite-type tricarboxylate transporter receptor subunit TctC
MRRRLLRCLAAFAGVPVPGVAPAQRQPTWPARPVRLVVAYPAGGISYEIARALAERLSRQLGMRVIVENRGGAGGVVAMAMLARANPDGYTIVFSAISPLVLAPQLGPVGFDPAHDIAAVVSVMVTPVLVLGTPALRADSFQGMLSLARAGAGKVRWATSGRGTTGHMVLEQVRRASGVEITHVPYKGGGPQLVDALSGQFEVLSSNVGPQQLTYVRDGRLKALAVGSPTRVAVLQDVPTLAELGYAAANLASVFGVFAPGRTPQPIVARLNEAFNRALQHPELRRRLEAINNLPTGGTPADFAQHIARERQSSRAFFEAEVRGRR